MEAPPLIVLYTSDEHVEESNKLRSLIKQTGFSYEEQNIDAGTISIRCAMILPNLVLRA